MHSASCLAAISAASSAGCTAAVIARLHRKTCRDSCNEYAGGLVLQSLHRRTE